MKSKEEARYAKKAELPAFAWLFSIIIGAAILFLAFFFVTQYGKQVAQPQEQVGLGSGINMLLEPFTAVGSLVEAKGSILEFTSNVYIEFGCNSVNDYSEIKAKKATHKTFDLTKNAYDKYIFSNIITTQEKESLLAFSVPIKEPFYIATPTIITKGNYCFVGLPFQYKNILESIDDNINETKYNFNYTSSQGSCPAGYTKVCFSLSGCDININCLDASCNYGSINDKFWFNELVFAGIFSKSETYNCNLDRILERAKKVAFIYKQKSLNLQNKGCAMGGMVSALDAFTAAIDNFKANKNANNLASLYSSISQIQNINSGLNGDCRIV